MALARLNIPGLILYGGSIAPGQYEGHSVTIQECFEAVGAHARGKINDAQLKELECAAAPAPARAAGSSPPTRWRWSANFWESRRWGFRACLPPTREKAPRGRTRWKACGGPAAQEHHAFANYHQEFN